MGLKAILSKLFASWANRELDHIRQNAIALQQKAMHQLVQQAAVTAFGKDHSFHTIHTYEDFKKACPNPRLRRPPALYRPGGAW